MEANTLYTTLITGASDNKTYKGIIDKKIDLMNMDIKIIFKFYEVLHILCNIYNEDKEKNINCTKISKDAEEFVKKYKEFNKYPNVTKDSPYYQVWFTLPTDYNYFKNYCAKNCSECSNIPQFPGIKAGQSSIQDNAELSAQCSEATSSSSSIASRLIPVLSTFVAIPIFLGIGYKYSIFEFDK
ncbi:CIR protein PIR protein, fragment [Plasmodium vinckei lentum]|uniref:CIR protein PIR protein n=1 Tax=Plasmodium vinckei lentum TaxID=138297 RepID=A0A6V7ST06_PLAVN|nr:CIR protein PIR protein, fragment [Plasmodium vinckei lentum]